MGGTELIFLILGAGLGFMGGRITHVLKKPGVSITPEPQATVTDTIEPLKAEPQPLPKNIEPPQAESQPLPENIESPKTEPQPLPENIEPLQEKLKQTQLAYEMAREMSQFKGGFLARTSHELRSPLSSLIGMHQLILSDLCDSPEEAREFVAQANTSALKMVKILDEVIAVSKTQHGTTNLEVRALPLTELFDEVYRLTHMQAANSNLLFEVVPPDPEIHVLADLRRFRQALVGIVDIAISHLSERKEGSIKVWTADCSDSTEACIWIDVQSPNLSWSEAVDLLSTIPTDEKQPDNSKLSPGLTLLMVQSIIEVMRGRLEVLPVTPEQVAASSWENFTRLQCRMPLATPESAEQVLA